MNYLVKSIQGKRDYMEDRWAYYISDSQKTPRVLVALVADGHGGDKMANKTSLDLPTLLIKNYLNSASSSTSKAVAIKKAVEEYGLKHKLENSGCTLTGILVELGNERSELRSELGSESLRDPDRKLYVFNVGDSRTLVHLKQKNYVYYLTAENQIQILNTGFLETRDHTPENVEEVKRVKEMGGTISGERLNGVLAVTKSLGDNGVGKGLSCSPDVFWVNLDFVKSPIVMFSDGIYEGFSSNKKETNQYTNHFLYHLGESFGPEGMVFWALKMGSGDNITALVVYL